jgi:hypothetical protein
MAFGAFGKGDTSIIEIQVTAVGASENVGLRVTGVPVTAMSIDHSKRGHGRKL